MFGFLGNIVSATVKVAITPLAVVKDIVVGEPFEETEALIESAQNDIEDIFD